MALSTENSGALFGGASHDPSKVYAKFSVATYVKSLGRNSQKDEVAKIDKEDARQLFCWGKARRATDEEVASVKEEVSSVEESLEAEVSEEVTDDDLLFQPEVSEQSENGASVENDAEGEAEVVAEPHSNKGGKKRR